MNRFLGYFLILLGILGVGVTLVVLAYLLLIIVIWCPLKNCLPQFFAVIVLGALSIGLCMLSMVKGQKYLERTRQM